MRALLILAAAALAACAAPAPPPGATQSIAAQPAPRTGFTATGTLSTVGSIEYELAPLLTRNALLRSDAARMLSRGMISWPRAEEVLRLTDQAADLIAHAQAENEAAARAALRARIALAQQRAAEIIEKGNRP